MSDPAAETSRAHTGRRRNEATRHAVLAAAVRLLRATDGGEPLSLPAIASEAGVGRQTVYRWWSTPGEVLLEALAERATAQVPMPDTGTLRGDLRDFLAHTFSGASRADTAPMLRGLAREAARDPQAAELLRRFTATRRAELRRVLERHVAPGADLDLLIDQAYGLLWYRLLLGHAPLDEHTANALADGLVAAMRNPGAEPRR